MTINWKFIFYISVYFFVTVLSPNSMDYTSKLEEYQKTIENLNNEIKSKKNELEKLEERVKPSKSVRGKMVQLRGELKDLASKLEQNTEFLKKAKEETPKFIIEPKESKVNWCPNLNFKFKGKILGNYNKDLYHSDNNIQWHIQKAQKLFDAYNFCQGGARRNVLSASLNIIYESQKEFKIYTIEFPEIFVNGWDNKDIQFSNNQTEYIKNLQGKFLTLSKTCTISWMRGKELLPKTYPPNKTRVSLYDSHSEKVLLAYLYNKVKDFKLPKAINRAKVHAFVLNIASLRDMCEQCVNMLDNEIVSENFLKNLKQNFSNVERQANLTILVSGISPYKDPKTEISTRDKLPFLFGEKHVLERKEKFINLPEYSNRLYHTSSPSYVKYQEGYPPELYIEKGWQDKQ